MNVLLPTVWGCDRRRAVVLLEATLAVPMAGLAQAAVRAQLRKSSRTPRQAQFRSQLKGIRFSGVDGTRTRGLRRDRRKP
jgi:hypothetical protein